MTSLLANTAASRLRVSAVMHTSLLSTTSLSTMPPVSLPPSLAPSVPRSAVSKALHTPSATTPTRRYSTAPNQHHVAQSFGTPFAQFVYTISRIARIITFTALGAATIGVVSFEAAHQYVEHIAMPQSAASSKNTPDEFGWNQLALEESWSGSPHRAGTDPRLGIKGRHAVRSAWMCVNWGGGISPGVLFGGGGAGSSGLGTTPTTSLEHARAFNVEDGMILAMQYLNLAVKIAARKAIKLPDTDAIRAGLVSEVAAKEQLGHVDPLALALEQRLAAVNERQGSRRALESAIASYEKLYHIATMVGEPNVHNATRRVRLATKLGDLHASLDQRRDAEEWLNKAIHIAATAGAHTSDLDQNDATHTDQTKPPKRYLSAWFSSKTPTPVEPPSEATLTSTHAAPTPALTRALITALVSKSAFHAHTPTPTSLHQALQTQLSALHLSTTELHRLTPSTTSNPHAHLHNLWLTHHQSILHLHIAETTFALSHPSPPPNLPTPLESINHADSRATTVIQALETKHPKHTKHGETHLRDTWTLHNQIRSPAQRVLRDAYRVRQTAQRCTMWLNARE